MVLEIKASATNTQCRLYVQMYRRLDQKVNKRCDTLAFSVFRTHPAQHQNNPYQVQ